MENSNLLRVLKAGDRLGKYEWLGNESITVFMRCIRSTSTFNITSININICIAYEMLSGIKSLQTARKIENFPRSKRSEDAVH